MSAFLLSLFVAATTAHAGPRDAELATALRDIRESLHAIDFHRRVSHGTLLVSAGVIPSAGLALGELSETARSPWGAKILRRAGDAAMYSNFAVGAGLLGYLVYLRFELWDLDRYVARARENHRVDLAGEGELARFLSLDPATQFELAKDDDEAIAFFVELAQWARTVRSALHPRLKAPVRFATPRA